jgi:hypothetical protein
MQPLKTFPVTTTLDACVKFESEVSACYTFQAVIITFSLRPRMSTSNASNDGAASDPPTLRSPVPMDDGSGAGTVVPEVGSVLSTAEVVPFRHATRSSGVAHEDNAAGRSSATVGQRCVAAFYSSF